MLIVEKRISGVRANTCYVGEMKEIFQFWAQICFLATPLARCPLAVVQRNDPNLSTSASVALPMSRTTCCTPPYPCSWSMGLCVQLCHPMCSYDRISRRDDPFSLWTIKCPMIVNRGWKSAKMGDKWTHQCSFGNQCSFRGCCELGEWLVIVVSSSSRGGEGGLSWALGGRPIVSKSKIAKRGISKYLTLWNIKGTQGIQGAHRGASIHIAGATKGTALASPLHTKTSSFLILHVGAAEVLFSIQFRRNASSPLVSISTYDWKPWKFRRRWEGICSIYLPKIYFVRLLKLIFGENLQRNVQLHRLHF